MSKIRCVIHVQNQTNRRDPFSSFFNTYSTKEELISSKPISIQVKELPKSSVVNFKGAVGKMDISASVDNTTIKANEAINYKIQIKADKCCVINQVVKNPKREIQKI